MTRLLANLSQFSGVDGRAETLEVVGELVSGGPPALLRESGLPLFASLAAAAALDSNAKCRSLAANALRTLFAKRFDSRKREQAVQLLSAWMDGRTYVDTDIAEEGAMEEKDAEDEADEANDGRSTDVLASALATPTGSGGVVAACAGFVVLSEAEGRVAFAARAVALAPAVLRVLEASAAASIEGSASSCVSKTGTLAAVLDEAVDAARILDDALATQVADALARARLCELRGGAPPGRRPQTQATSTVADEGWYKERYERDGYR